MRQFSPTKRGIDILDSSALLHLSCGLPLPRRGCVSKPRVAASATLGKKAIRKSYNRNAVATA